MMFANGSGERRVAGNASDPAWSPDGKSIAFVRRQKGHGEIYVMSSDGTDQTRLTRTFAEDIDPAWSRRKPDRIRELPGGAAARYLRSRCDACELERASAATAGSTDEVSPGWSPIGERRRFHALRSERHDG